MRITLGVILAVLLHAFASAEPAAPPKAPPLHVMVAAANPLAVESGLKVLRRGGSAVDAAVAVQATLGLVEPQSSGIGGGAFMVVYNAKTHTVTSYDGRETAPAGATPDMFLGPDGKPLPFAEAVLSGRSAGVPGAVAMLALAQHEHGKLAWSSLFDDAERLASDGLTVSPRMASAIASKAPQASAPDVIAYFTRADGKRMAAGDTLRNPAYAATLRRIAAEGPSALLTGSIAADIVARLAAGPLPGTMTLADLAAYKPRESKALCAPYRVWTLCVPDLPSGGSATLQGMALLQRTDIDKRGPGDAQAWLQLAQAERLMFADRDRYVGDPAFVKVPLQGMLDPAYLDARAKLIGDHAGPPPAAGTPPGAMARGADNTVEPGGTSSFSIVDADGDVVCMTTTVESLYGDGRMVDGFMLNNQLTDFSFSPKADDGTPAANAVGPGKRPRSSMSPTIVLDAKGAFVATVGSPGGPAIPAYVLKSLVAVLDWKMSMQDAVALPNLVAMRGYFIGDPTQFAPGVADGLAAKGAKLQSGFGEASGLHGIMVRNRVLEGGADPRREGVARGY